jgi:cobalt/nickel transport system ATP-binding protein
MHHTIDVKSLQYSYPDGTQALKGVDLYVAPGEKVALVGPNGSGKSTLLLHLNGILKGEGEVCVCGHPVNDENLGQIRASVGLVFQDPDDQLFMHSVFEDVAFGPMYLGLERHEIDIRVNEALIAVGMDSYQQRVSHHLSMGEKKRVAIASVLSMQPEILVLDEPTAGLDPRSRRELIRLLDDLDQTMLIATHDMRMVAELLPRTVVVNAGLVVIDAQTQGLMANTELLESHGLEAP